MSDLRAFANFITIVDLGSVSRAAERIGLTQSALSQQVAALEAEFCGRLLHRTPKGVIATDAGAVLYRHFKAVLHHVEIARHDVASSGGEPAGTVSVGMPASAAEILAAPLFDAVRARLPNVNLRINGLANRFLIDLVRGNTVDFALIIGATTEKGLTCMPVAAERVFVMMGPGSRLDYGGGAIDPLELAAGEFILPCHPHSIRTLLDEELAIAGTRITVAGEMDCHSALVALTATGRYESILPWSAIHRAVAAGIIHARPIARLERRLNVCVSDGTPMSTAATAVQTLMLDLVGTLVRSGKWCGVALIAEQSVRSE